MEAAVEATRVLQPGMDISFDPAGDGDRAPLTVRVRSVTQRPWSRNALAVDDAGNRYFLKQMRGLDGRWHGQHYTDEAHGHLLARRVVRSLTAEPLVGQLPGHLLLAYPAVTLVTPDELLRRDPAQLARIWPGVCDAMAALIRDLEASDEAVRAGLRVKQRPYASIGTTLSFKGLDVRNLGISDGTPSVTHIFDLGRAYVAPVEEAAAKLFVSVGLLNWGFPIRRFLGGPPLDLLEPARTALLPWLAPGAVAIELAGQARTRRANPTGRTAAERAARRVVIGSAGQRYLRQLRGWLGARGL